MSNESEKKKENGFVTLMGYQELQIRKLKAETPSGGAPTPSGAPSGGATESGNWEDVETVRVMLLAPKDYPRLLAAQGDEIALAMLFTGKPKEWVEALHPECHELVIETGEAINGAFFARWLSRQHGRIERVRPGLFDDVLQNVKQERSASTSGSGIPASSAGSK